MRFSAIHNALRSDLADVIDTIRAAPEWREIPDSVLDLSCRIEPVNGAPTAARGRVLGDGQAEWSHAWRAILSVGWIEDRPDAATEVLLDLAQDAIAALERGSAARALGVDVDAEGYDVTRAGDYIEATIPIMVRGWHLIAKRTE